MRFFALMLLLGASASAGEVRVKDVPLPSFLEAVALSFDKSPLLVDIDNDKKITFNSKAVTLPLVSSYTGLAYCEDADHLVFGKFGSIRSVCSSLGASVINPSPADSGVAGFGPFSGLVEVNIFEISENKSRNLGLDFSRNILADIVRGVSTGNILFSATEFSRSFTALESKGLARKVDTVTLPFTVGKKVNFHSGGQLQLSLLSGDSKIQRDVDYGLSLDFSPSGDADNLNFLVGMSLSSPVSVGDSSRLDLSTRRLSLDVPVKKDKVAFLSAFSTNRNEHGFAGLPGLPVGKNSDSFSKSTFVVSLRLK